ncbi:hypothetical protein [Massilia rhizosphaerae]|uniref:hypothetical protein n=1 Tax=Massilia rhizosphaerae TaxID=2784389 RepID=UPI0018DB7D0B|nr:hypothetical protein [Massilia rhizosphaerae]
MVQNKKLGAGLALVAALIGMGASGTAAALPELQVGSHVVQDSSTVDAQAQPVDQATDEESDSTASNEGAEMTSD